MFDYRTAMTVDVPEGASGSAKIKRFEVTESDVRWEMIRGGGRGYTAPGAYTKLTVNGALWMSDTWDEQRDHYSAVSRAQDLAPGARCLVTGLGIGMVVQALILTEPVAHIDVVELNADVAALVGPHVEAKAREHGKTLTVHVGDAHERKTLFGPSDRWQLAWHDIWKDITTDNWESMKRMRRVYGRYVDWQGCWADGLVRLHLRREREENARYESLARILR